MIYIERKRRFDEITSLKVKVNYRIYLLKVGLKDVDQINIKATAVTRFHSLLKNPS